jgi:hypothetical protein
MNLLIAARHGIRLYHELRKSETAWQALRFYEPIEIPVGVFIRVGSISAALSLVSDLRYFIRKYSSTYFFEISPGICCTHAVAKRRYINRENNISDPWPWKLWFWLGGDGEIKRFYCPPSDDNSIDGEKGYPGGYILEVWCLKEEFSCEVHQNQNINF